MLDVDSHLLSARHGEQRPLAGMREVEAEIDGCIDEARLATRPCREAQRLGRLIKTPAQHNTNPGMSSDEAVVIRFEDEPGCAGPLGLVERFSCAGQLLF